MNKLVSIILPTYNGAGRIKEAIKSILGQSYTDLELLVVDDGSVDNTREVVESLVKSDSRIRYLKNETNLGIQRTLNKGLKEAKGEYIARIDDDDEWIDKDKLKKQIEFLEKNKDYVLVGTGFIAVDENNKEIFRFINPELDKDIRQTILNKNCFLHSSVVFRKDVAFKCGGYSELEDVKHIEDYDLWLRLGILGKFTNLPTYSVFFTLRKESISSKNKVLQFEKCIKIIKKFKKEYPSYLLANILLHIRMMAYIILNFKLFRSFLASLYKLYKNI